MARGSPSLRLALSAVLLLGLSSSALSLKAAAPVVAAVAGAPATAPVAAPVKKGGVAKAAAPGVATTTAKPTDALKPKTQQGVTGSGVCPLTGKAPFKPSTPLPRCQVGKDLSCCTACQDAGNALSLISRNGSTLLGFLGLVKDPSLSPFISAFSGALASKQLCSLFKKNDLCLDMIESMYCGLNCDAAAGSYLKVDPTGTTGNMTVCSAFSTQLYNACSTLLIPGINAPISQYVDTPQDLLNMIIGPLVLSTTPLKNLNISVDDGTVQQVVPTCFSGPATYPSVTVCCDSLTSVNGSCFTSGNTSSVYQTLVGRPLPDYCPASNGTSASGATKGALSAQGVSLFTTLATALLGVAAVLSL